MKIFDPYFSTKSDKNGTSFHQMWGKYNFSERFAMKLGRQEISYDDQRIFGAVDWAQQARSQHVAMFKYKNGYHPWRFAFEQFYFKNILFSY